MVEGPDWPRIERALLRGEIVPIVVISAGDGKIASDVFGARGIMPTSEWDWQKEFSDFEGFVGRRAYAVVKAVDKPNGLVAISRKEARQMLAARTLRRLKPGSETDGIVVGVGDHAAFVDIGGVTAILPIREVSHGFVRDLRSMLGVDDRVRARVMEMDAGTGRVVLSTRALADDPWEEFCRNTRKGDTVLGRVAGLLPERRLVFVTVKRGVDGLAYYPKHLEIEKGQWIRCLVKDIQSDKRRVRLQILNLVAGRVSSQYI